MRYRYKLLFFLCFVLITGLALQVKANVKPPKAQDIEKIETTNNLFRFYTPGTLLRILPSLVPVTPRAVEWPGYQHGTITLKDGTVIKWKSSHFGNLTLNDGTSEQFYVKHDSFIESWLGLKTYTFISLAAFWIMLLVLLSLRNQLVADRSLAPELIRKDYWKILLLRITAFAMLAVLAYLMLRIPLQEINDGAMLVGPGRFSDRGYQVSFADVDAKAFWTYIGFEILFSGIPFLLGLLLLAFNPKRLFWAKKPKQFTEESDLQMDSDSGKWNFRDD